MSSAKTRPVTLSVELYAVEIRTEQWEVMVEWYRHVLGLRVVIRVVEDGYAQLIAGLGRLALIAGPAAVPPSNRYSLAFEVSDIDAMAARLQTVGWPHDPPQRNEEGLLKISTQDPDGNRLRLFAWR